MSDDEQQERIPITMDRLKARGYVHSSSWGISSAFRHSHYPGWTFCNSPRLIKGCYPIIWTGGGLGRDNGKHLEFMHELQRMEETTSKE